MKKGTCGSAALGIVAAAAALAATGAQAQGKVVLRFADSLPANHLFTETVAKPWMAEVKRRSNDTIDFQHYPAEQLGKATDMLTLAQTGVADIAFIVPPYVSDKMPLSGVAELPGGFSSSCAGVKALWKLASGGTLERTELQPNGLRLLFAIVQPPFQVYTTRQKIETLKDLEGLKLRTTGGAMDLMARKLKAVPVRMPAPEVHESLSRGTIDGGILAKVSVGAYNLLPLLKHGTDGENFGSAALLYAIGNTGWNKLNAEQRKVLADAGRDITFSACQKIDDGATKDVEKMKAAGMSVYRIAASDRPQLTAALDAIGNEWAEALDKRGKPGSQVLKEFRDALK